MENTIAHLLLSFKKVFFEKLQPFLTTFHAVNLLHFKPPSRFYNR